MPKLPMTIDLTKPTLSWKYMLVLTVIIAIILAVYAVSTYLFSKAKGLTSGMTKKAVEPTI